MIAGVLGLTILVIGAFYKPIVRVAYEPIMKIVMSVALTPPGDFDDDTTPPAPDYALATSWAALPETDDAADRSPAGL
ncbi:MAG: hypothetical protein ACJAYU_003629 [Bradymonadia bacterium]|jgi:hypothetical protein